MTALILYSIIATAACYLAGRAKITRWAWRRYPKWLESFALCYSCLGFWVGIACGFYGRWRGFSLVGMDSQWPETVVVAGLVCTVTAPLIGYVHLSCLEALSPAEDVSIQT